MKNHLLPAVRLTLVCIAVFAILYPAAITGIAYLAAPQHGEGETVMAGGRVVGYRLVGQSFTLDKYFNGRPSAVGYNAAGSGGSNKGPSNPDYLAAVKLSIDTFLLRNPTVRRADIPVELVTASGSGLDPDISPRAAYVQVARIARSRGMSEDRIYALVSSHISAPWWGLMEPAKVNVLQINIDLDNLK